MEFEAVQEQRITILRQSTALGWDCGLVPRAPIWCTIIACVPPGAAVDAAPNVG